MPVVGCDSVLKPEGHHLIIIIGELCHEGSLALISGVHMDLVIPQEGIQKAEKVGSLTRYPPRHRCWATNLSL